MKFMRVGSNRNCAIAFTLFMRRQISHEDIVFCLTSPSSQTGAVTSGVVTSISMAAVTAFFTVQTIGAILRKIHSSYEQVYSHDTQQLLLFREFFYAFKFCLTCTDSCVVTGRLLIILFKLCTVRSTASLCISAASHILLIVT